MITIKIYPHTWAFKFLKRQPVNFEGVNLFHNLELDLIINSINKYPETQVLMSIRCKVKINEWSRNYNKINLNIYKYCRGVKMAYWPRILGVDKMRSEVACNNNCPGWMGLAL